MIGFGDFGKERNSEEIKTITDERLIKIDPSMDGFYDKVLVYHSRNKNIQAFQEATEEIKEAELKPFWKPTLDPAYDGKKIIFKKGQMPAVGHSYNWWEDMAKKMPPVEGKSWQVGTEYQYYAFLVHLINQLVEKPGWNIGTAIEAVVLDSKVLGHYANSKNAIRDFEPTGSREICGCSDLGNTCKILRCSNKEVGGLWLAGGKYINNGNNSPLADLGHDGSMDVDYNYSVGWLVLE